MFVQSNKNENESSIKTTTWRELLRMSKFLSAATWFPLSEGLAQQSSNAKYDNSNKKTAEWAQ